MDDVESRIVLPYVMPEYSTAVHALFRTDVTYVHSAYHLDSSPDSRHKFPNRLIFGELGGYSGNPKLL